MTDKDPLQIRVQQLKTYHGVNKDIAQQFKLQDNGGLSVLYNDQWIQLTHQNNINKFYTKSSLKTYGVGFMRALKLIPAAQPKQHVFQAPTMNDIRNDMISDWPLPEGLHKPLTPIKRGLTAKTLEFRQTPFTIANFLKAYEMNIPFSHETEKDSYVFLQEVKPEIQKIITSEISKLGGVKFQLGL